MRAGGHKFDNCASNSAGLRKNYAAWWERGRPARTSSPGKREGLVGEEKSGRDARGPRQSQGGGIVLAKLDFDTPEGVRHADDHIQSRTRAARR